MTTEQLAFIEAKRAQGLSLREIFRLPDCPISRASYYRHIGIETIEATSSQERDLLVKLVQGIEALNLREELEPSYSAAKALLQG